MAKMTLDKLSILRDLNEGKRLFMEPNQPYPARFFFKRLMGVPEEWGLHRDVKGVAVLALVAKKLITGKPVDGDWNHIEYTLTPLGKSECCPVVEKP